MIKISNPILRFWFGLTFILIFFCAASAQQDILPVDQVKAGMKGVGKTVFEGNKIEEFKVDILGVLKNYPTAGPKKSIIMAKLNSPRLENSGVLHGMSGSPVYVEGKLIGAVALGYAFSKEAIVGITPIEAMLAIEREKDLKSSYRSQLPVKKYLSLDELFTIHSNIFQGVEGDVYAGKVFAPLKVPLVFSGFSSKAFDRSRPVFLRLGFTPLHSGLSPQENERITIPDLSLHPGDHVGAQLISGDLSMAATGTVTHVEGNKVLAFGHPWYNLGAVDYAMAKAYVIALVPSVSESFMLAATDAIVGRFSQDRHAGVFGELGKKARMIPVNIQMLSAENEIKEIKIQLAEDKILTPFLLNAAVSTIMMTEERSVGDLSLELKGIIYLDNGMSVELEDLFSGNFDSSIGNLTNLITAVTFFLTNNEFEDLSIHRIDLNFHATENVRISTLEKVWLDKYDVAPGERIQVKIFTRSFRGESVVHEGGLQAPHLPSGSEFYLIVSDTASLQQIERIQYKTQGIMPRSLNQLVRLLNNLRKNNRIYLKVLAAKPGLFLRGEEMPNLPPTMKSMFSSRRAASSPATDLTRSTLSQSQIMVDYVFKGATVIPVKIK